MSMDETLRTIYGQDCEFVRYHDGLMWSRFQTVAAIEAAMLYGRYRVDSLMGVDRILFLFFGSVLVLLCCLLAFRNRKVSLAHLERIRHIENEAAVRKLSYHRPPHSSADVFLWVAAIVLTASNAWIIGRLLCVRS